MGEALDLGLDQLTARKQSYKTAGLEYFRPWLFVITDGAPTDGQRFEAAAARANEATYEELLPICGAQIRVATGQCSGEVFQTFEHVRELVDTANELTGTGPTVRVLGKTSGVTVRELYQLFPKGPAKVAAKIAGIPKPRGCI